MADQESSNTRTTPQLTAAEEREGRSHLSDATAGRHEMDVVSPDGTRGTATEHWACDTLDEAKAAIAARYEAAK